MKASPDMTAKIEIAIRRKSTGLIAEQFLAGPPERDADGDEPAEEQGFLKLGWRDRSPT